VAESEPRPARADQKVEDRPPAVRANPMLCCVLAWLVPGAGHLYLRRWRRGILFLVLVMAALALGVGLEGKLWRFVPGQPLSYLGTLACIFLGLPYFVLRFFMGYEGDVLSQGYEYGAAFLFTAGLMNLLLVLDTWDIAKGWKE
jgi:hypothetical protein